MQFKKSTVVGVVMTLYLSTGSWCMYISENRIKTPNLQNETSQSRSRIQICGNELTNVIIEACDGILGSLNQANGSKESAEAKISEDCCEHGCHWEYLQSYCGQTPVFSELLSPDSNSKKSRKIVQEKLLSTLDNRIPPTKQNGSIPNVVQNPPAERRNNINRPWPPIQVGTISPDIDKFGGQPTVVVKKNKSNPA